MRNEPKIMKILLRLTILEMRSLPAKHQKILNIIWERKLEKTRILDLGCGKGEVLQFLRIGIGLEFNKESAILCQKRGIQMVLSNANYPLPFRSGVFECVIAADVIEHLYETKSALHECRRLLKKEGVLILTLPNFSWWKSRIKSLLGILPDDVENLKHYRHFTWEKTTELIRESGFKVIRCVRCGELIEHPIFRLVPLSLSRSIFIVSQPKNTCEVLF